jgi:putative hydrolase of the HAD superfamily
MPQAPAYLLSDLDETLYPSSCGLMQAVSARMSLFVARYLKVGQEEAARIRRRLRVVYGTTLTGLMREHGLEVAEQYLAFTHDVPVDSFLSEDPQLAEALSSIPLPKSVLTNSPLEHAERILARLGVRRLFERVFDLRFNRFTGKPDPGVYRRALGELGRRAPEVLLVDNHLDYLAPFRAMGGQVLLIDEKGEAAGSGLRDGIPSLRDFKELPSFLASLSPPRPARH